MTRKLQRHFAVWGLLLLLVCIGHRSQAQSIRLDLHQTDLARVVAVLQQQAPTVNFSFSQDELEKVRLDHVVLKSSSLQEALDVLQSKYGLHFLMDGKNVTLKYVPVPPPASESGPGSRTLTGMLADDNGQPVVGATVHVRGTNYSVVSNEHGVYSVMVQPGAQLIVSSIGFNTENVTVKGSGSLDIRMHPGTNVLNEVVFIGYQKMRKSDFTGAVASVKSDELNVSAPNVGQALVGKVAGVVVSQTDGSPYASPKIRVRGVGSFNAATDPLYVIDGYPTNDLYINPADIESIDILKDAASAAIYGSRASGGVVLITTKRGKEGKSKLEYDVQVGSDQLAHKVKLLNAVQFAQLTVDGHNDSYKDLVQNGGLVWNDAMYSDNNTTRVARVGNGSSVSIPTELYNFQTQTVIPPTYNTDWQDQVFRHAGFSKHNLSFTGGSKTVRYMISGDVQSQEGILLNTSQRRVNFRANVDGDISEKMKVGASLSFTGNTNHETQEGRWDHSPVFGALIYMPVFPAYNADGSVATYLADAESSQFGYQSIENPIATAERTQITRTGNRATYNAFASYELISHLIIKANLGYQTYGEKYNYYLPSSLSSGTFAPFSPQSVAAAYAQAQNESFRDELGEFTGTYSKEFGAHHIDLLAGYSVQYTNTDVLNVTAKGFQNDLVPDVIAGGAGQIYVNTPTSTVTTPNQGTLPTENITTTLESYFGRIQYNYAGKYYLSGSLRTDGSSRFGVQDKWGTFPSVSAGWNISKEPFYKGWLEDNTTLRLRGSWGLSGNNNIGDYKSLQVFNNPVSTTFGVGNSSSLATAYQLGNVADASLGWESTSQYNIGADLGLFHDRISLIANYYDSRTYNLLVNQPISAVSGSTTLLTNLRNTKIQNKGFDFQVDAKVIRTNKFNLNFVGNISINRNKVLSMGGLGPIINDGAERQYITHITEQGQPIGMFYGYKVAGMVRAKDTANIDIDNQNYSSTTQNFPKGYVLKGPPRSTAQTNPLRPGDLYFKDVNGDGVVNSKDLSIIGTPYPKFTYGFNLNANYGPVDLSASFAGSYGNQVLDGQDYYLFNMEGSGNQYSVVSQRYRSESQPGNGHVYRASRAGTQSNSTRLSTFYLQDGSFFRCTNIALGFNVPSFVAMKKAGVSAIRVVASMNNAFTITKYKGYNPEVDYNYSVNGATSSNNTSNLTPGVDYGVYPLVRSYDLGVHVIF